MNIIKMLRSGVAKSLAQQYPYTCIHTKSFHVIIESTNINTSKFIIKFKKQGIYIYSFDTELEYCDPCMMQKLCDFIGEWLAYIPRPATKFDINIKRFLDDY